MKSLYISLGATLGAILRATLRIVIANVFIINQILGATLGAIHIGPLPPDDGYEIVGDEPVRYIDVLLPFLFGGVLLEQVADLDLWFQP